MNKKLQEKQIRFFYKNEAYSILPEVAKLYLITEGKTIRSEKEFKRLEKECLKHYHGRIQLVNEITKIPMN